MAKVRVLRLISRLNVGGPAHHVLLLAQRLDPDQYETLLVAGQEPQGEQRAELWIAAYQVPVHYLPALQREPGLWHDLRTLVALWRLIRRYKPHLIHTHTAKAGALGRLAAWLAGVPVRVHTYHGHSLEGYFSPIVSWLYLQAERLLARITHAIVAISERQRRDLVERFRVAPAHKVRVIPLGFDLERLERYDAQRVTELRTMWLGGASGPLLGWIGRLVPIKRVDKLLQALAQLKHAHAGVRLVIVGEGPERPKLEGLVQKLQLTDRVYWAGLRWDMPEVLRALDAVLLVSDNEGTPVTLIEALACGVPVAATPVGGVPDLLEEGRWGYLLHEPLSESLAAFLSQLPQARAQAQAAQLTIRQRYHASRLVQDIQALYRELL